MIVILRTSCTSHDQEGCGQRQQNKIFNYDGIMRSTGPESGPNLESVHAFSSSRTLDPWPEQPPSRHSSNIRHFPFQTICQDSLL